MIEIKQVISERSKLHAEWDTLRLEVESSKEDHLSTSEHGELKYLEKGLGDTDTVKQLELERNSNISFVATVGPPDKDVAEFMHDIQREEDQLHRELYELEQNRIDRRLRQRVDMETALQSNTGKSYHFQDGLLGERDNKHETLTPDTMVDTVDCEEMAECQPASGKSVDPVKHQVRKLLAVIPKQKELRKLLEDVIRERHELKREREEFARNKIDREMIKSMNEQMRSELRAKDIEMRQLHNTLARLRVGIKSANRQTQSEREEIEKAKRQMTHKAHKLETQFTQKQAAVDAERHRLAVLTEEMWAVHRQFMKETEWTRDELERQVGTQREKLKSQEQKLLKSQEQIDAQRKDLREKTEERVKRLFAYI